MSENKYIMQKQKIYTVRKSDIFSLINRAKLETKKDKNKSITFTLFAITALIASSLFITQ